MQHPFQVENSPIAHQWDFQQVTSSANYPRSNGLAERSVRLVESISQRNVVKDFTLLLLTLGREHSAWHSAATLLPKRYTRQLAGCMQWTSGLHVGHQGSKPRSSWACLTVVIPSLCNPTFSSYQYAFCEHRNRLAACTASSTHTAALLYRDCKMLIPGQNLVLTRLSFQKYIQQCMNDHRAALICFFNICLEFSFNSMENVKVRMYYYLYLKLHSAYIYFLLTHLVVSWPR